jgi:hypothetical protein
VVQKVYEPEIRARLETGCSLARGRLALLLARILAKSTAGQETFLVNFLMTLGVA